MTTQVAEETKFDVVFTESDFDPAQSTGWYQSLMAAFPDDRKPTFWVMACMTLDEFKTMTGRDDILNNIGYVLEHYDGPGVFGADIASDQLDALCDAINEADGECWDPIDPEQLTTEEWQALLSVMKDTLSLDWEVQSDLVDEEFMTKNREKIDLFMKPLTDC